MKLNKKHRKIQSKLRKTRNKKYGKTRCKWCNKTFTRKHTRQTYCTTNCAQEARREQDRQWQHKHKKRRKRLGSTHISQHANKKHEIEQIIISKEKRRTGI